MSSHTTTNQTSQRPERERSLALTLCAAYFVLAQLLALVLAFISDRELFDYDISMIRVLILMAGGTTTLWLMSVRAHSARWLGALTVLSFLFLSFVDHAVYGAFEILAGYIGPAAVNVFVVLEYVGGAAVALYLMFGPQAQRLLIEPPDMVPGSATGHSWDIPLKERIKTWEFWRDLMIYFIVFSLLGHWAEMLFCQLIVAGVFMGGYDPTNTMLWSQWLFPFTAEGAALVAIVLILHPTARWLLKKTGGRVLPALVLSFLLNALVSTAIDFTTGMVSNQHYELWDYRDMPFNFMGQVCLQNSIVYSIAATLIVWLVYPLMDRALRRAPRGVVNAIAFGLIGMYLFLALLNFVDIN
ncbi:MAG: putative ABC transporter permease [Atopobiaceae bacterium]|nr:putative ABC transporter permease [Atopobiaceae bacterium]